MFTEDISSKTEEELKRAINLERIPRHVAIIMDGNGRWAKKRLHNRVLGHRAGARSVRSIVEAAVEINISVLTLYAFSFENWARPKEEVNALMELLVEYLQKELADMKKHDLRLMSIGDISKLPASVRGELQSTINQTAGNKGMILNLALNYSGHQEIVEAARKIALDFKQEKIRIEDVDEKLFSQYLFTRDIPDPDLIIRTSGEMRVSNFLLWQLAYSEFWITPTLWPDFSRKEFYQAILGYQSRQRRFGRVTSE
ncbi:MAG: isoprenyl transferase [bacterium]